MDNNTNDTLVLVELACSFAFGLRCHPSFFRLEHRQNTFAHFTNLIFRYFGSHILSITIFSLTRFPFL